MWIVYGVCLVCSWISSALIGDSFYSVILLVVGVLAPIVIMVICHHTLVKKYVLTE